jgi:hypothetical protein
MKTRLNLELQVCGLKNRGLSTIVRALYDSSVPQPAVHKAATQWQLPVVNLPLMSRMRECL